MQKNNSILTIGLTLVATAGAFLMAALGVKLFGASIVGPWFVGAEHSFVTAAIAFAALLSATGLLVTITGAPPVIRWALGVIVGLVVFAVSLIDLVIFASPSTMDRLHWLAAGILGGLVFAVFASKRLQGSLRGPEMFTDPSNDWRY